ncbi:fibronectin type III domain-containing protein [uncultured Pseudokineococcus sp.]|uniref:rhamnogalacturonan lyase family protein n=1 Tax=uncultured Pseudokineococcus sp. TaxID=1642928 RepID=UPI002623FCE1|nr:fibronectin type III domain-containing protein [uncultured Pseudokineococcus sp.]
MAAVTAGALTALGAPALATGAAPAPTSWSFDLGTASSPVADGWTGVPESNRYSAEAGYGIVPAGDVSPISRHRTGTDTGPVAEDFVLGTAWGFAVDVPDGAYDVRVLSGDVLPGTSSTRTSISLEGAPVGSVSARQSVSEETWRTVVEDGQLTVDVTGAGAGGYVNGIQVTEVEVDPEDPAASLLPAPQDVRMARVTDDAVVVRWDEVPGAAGYVLERAAAVAGPYTEVARVEGRDVFTTDRGVDTTAVHYYRARAVDAAGEVSVPSQAAASSLTTPAPALEGPLVLDLGSGELAEGAVRVDASTAYSADQRYGLVDPRAASATDRGGDDPLRGDFLTLGATELVVDLPPGDYTVDLVAGDTVESSDLSMEVEQMAKVLPTALPAGELLEMSFDIALVDGQLNVDVGGTAPKLAALTITPQAPREAGAEPTAWITGDSTVQTYTDDYTPQAGWGQMLDRYLTDDVSVVNRAIGGRSSKNFISQGRLDDVLLDVRPGDYLFAQFGHNDNSYGVDDRFAAPADYREYLRTFVDGARQRGATPILVTPVSRRSFAADGTANVSFPAYVEAVRELAAETGAPLVDLSASSRALLTEIGPERAKSVFLWVPAGVYPNRPNGTQDDTHFQDYGAVQMARLVAADVARLDIPLAQEVVEAEPPAQVPAAPTGVVAGSVSSSGTVLTWEPVEGADIYQVERKDAGAPDADYVLATTSTVARAAVTGLAEGASYDLRVVAVNGRGESRPSAAVRVTTRAALLRLDVQRQGDPLAEGWTALDETTAYTPERGFGWLSLEPAIAGRDRGTDFPEAPDDVERDFLLPAPVHELAIDVPRGTYAVTTYNGDWIGTSRSEVQIEGRAYGSSNAGRGAVSKKISQPVDVVDGQINLVMTGSSSRLNGVEVTALLLAPTALAAGDVDVEGSGVAVPLSWAGVPEAAGYRVYRQAPGAAEAEALADVQETSYVDTTAAVGLEYAYRVVALDAAGTESVPTEDVLVTTVDDDVATAPVPTGLAVTDLQARELTLTWAPSEGAGYYLVYRAEGAEGAPGADGELALVGRADGPTFTDTDVLTTVPYRYAVAAVNAGGTSERSEVLLTEAPTVLERQAERLDRSPVAVAVDGGAYVGWRMLGLDPESVAFHVYRDGERVTDEPLTGSTNLLDADGGTGSTYRVSAVVEGVERWATEDFSVWDDQTLDIPLDKPADGVDEAGQPYTYAANDASVADLDGDGELEVVLKWDPSNAKDNSRAGYTGPVYVDAYEVDGTRLWRIDLGRNIRAGAHYTQFQVYDLDGDGRAEVTMKTADATVDGQGRVIGDASADFRNSGGYVLTGPEYLTVFDGATGAAVDTVDYTPPRGDVGAWGDGYGNRVDRFLAGTAYLDGERPSVIFSRGYYTRAVVAAYDFDGAELTQRWVFDTDQAGSQYRGQGNHQLAVADVDGDQKDEVVFGSLTLDDDGTPLYNTRLGHGDALHVSDFAPGRPGLEVFAAHEDMGASGQRGATFRDAATGEIIWSIPATRDTGRAAMGDVDPRHEGAEGWAVGGDAAWNSRVGEMRSADGELLSTSIPAANFLTWWDGDLLREITDHDYDADRGAGVPTIAKWDWEAQEEVEVYRASGTLTANGTKGTPAIQADLFGDWREEVVTRLEDSSALRVHTTTDVTEHRLRTLMSDPTYRLAVAWQNTSYNQPPHTSYFLGAGMEAPPAPSIAYTGEDPGPGELVEAGPQLVLAGGVVAGGRTTVSVSGFAPREAVDVVLDGRRLARVRTDAEGRGEVTAVVHPRTSTGSAEVVATGRVSGLVVTTRVVVTGG